MIETVAAAAVLVASVALTSFCCLRPMRRGHGCTRSPEVDEITRLRREVASLRGDEPAGQAGKPTGQ